MIDKDKPVILVTGSRGIDSYPIVFHAIKEYPVEPHKIVHGNAKGVDNQADTYAKVFDIEVEQVEPKYIIHGDKAPLKRNEVMIQKADGVIAIWNRESRGTKYTIDKAREDGMKVLPSSFDDIDHTVKHLVRDEYHI